MSGSTKAKRNLEKAERSKFCVQIINVIVSIWRHTSFVVLAGPLLCSPSPLSSALLSSPLLFCSFLRAGSLLQQSSVVSILKSSGVSSSLLVGVSPCSDGCDFHMLLQPRQAWAFNHHMRAVSSILKGQHQQVRSCLIVYLMISTKASFKMSPMCY